MKIENVLVPQADSLPIQLCELYIETTQVWQRLMREVFNRVVTEQVQWMLATTSFEEHKQEGGGRYQI